MMPRTRPGGLVIAGVLFLLAAPGRATEYFVDFSARPGAGCDDGNAGTDRKAPWCTVPGTRRANDADWLHAAWGSITQAHRLTAGDTVWIHGGTHTKARGGRLLIGRCNGGDCPTGGEGFYANGTPSGPIQIRNGAAHSPPWGSGDVTFDCAGMTITDGGDACIALSDYDTARANWVWIRGADASHRIRVLNSSRHGIAAYTDAGPAGILAGFVLEFFEVAHSAQMGVTITHADSTTVKSGTVHASGSSGVAFGMGAGASPRTVRDGTLVDVEVHDNGTNEREGNRNGFNCFDCGTPAQAAVNLRGYAHDNGRDGADNGLLNRSGSAFILYLDYRGVNNGEDGLACNGDPSCAGCNATCSAVGNIIFRGGNDGTVAYEAGANLLLTNSVIHVSGSATTPPGSSAGCHGDSGNVSETIRNVICYRPFGGKVAWGSAGGASGSPTRMVRNSIYIPRTGDGDAFAPGLDFDTAPGSYFKTFVGNQLGISSPNFDQPHLFTATDDTTYAANDYHPGAGSRAIDAGAPYCKAKDAAASGRVLTVDCDPRLYFYVSAKRPLVPADTAFIGTGTQVCTVTGLTGSTITCAAPVSWKESDTVARVRQVGAALDAGVFESAVASGQ